jgi:hypothetical protein
MTIAGIKGTEKILYQLGEVSLTEVETITVETGERSKCWREVDVDGKTILHFTKPEWLNEEN